MVELYRRPYSGAARIHKNGTNQSVTGDSSGGGVTKVTFSTASFDTWGWFDNANDRLVVDRPGKYIAVGQYVFTGGIAANDLMLAMLYVNGSSIAQGNLVSPGTADCSPQVTDVLNLLAGDYVELNCYKGGANTAVFGGVRQTYLSLAYLGR